MKIRMQRRIWTRNAEGGGAMVRHFFEVTIDPERLPNTLLEAAGRNKGGKARRINGAVVVRELKP